MFFGFWGAKGLMRSDALIRTKNRSNKRCLAKGEINVAKKKVTKVTNIKINHKPMILKVFFVTFKRLQRVAKKVTKK